MEQQTVAAFYHVWVDGDWQEPLAEFLGALNESAFTGHLYIGAVGSSFGKWRLERFLDRQATLFHASNGWEMLTMNLILAYAKQNEGAVLYAHDKGSHRPDLLTATWRRAMTECVVMRWRQNLVLLDTVDALGWVWFDERVYWDRPAFPGNFWMANCAYLRRLDPCPVDGDRAEGEVWLGSGNPRVYEYEDWDPQEGPEILRPVWNAWIERWREMTTLPGRINKRVTEFDK